jgi:hypothetical protein
MIPIVIASIAYTAAVTTSFVVGKILEAIEIRKAEAVLLKCDEQFKKFLASESSKLMDILKKEVEVRESNTKLVRFNSAANTILTYEKGSPALQL